MGREGWLDRATDFESHIALIPRGHHHQNIDIAVLVRCAVGVRAEENDLFRVKAVGDLADELADHARWDMGTAVPAGRLPGFCRWHCHEVTLHGAAAKCQPMATRRNVWAQVLPT